MPPDERTIAEVASRLSKRYGDWCHHNRANPLEELLFILCSIQTNESLYRTTFRSLRRAFPTFRDLAEAGEAEIANAIRIGGLSKQKAKKIKRVMSQVIGAYGRPTLAPLAQMPDDECERFLTSLHGVGKKTARCVMMYSLKRPAFPVDTHCWRICQRLGWVRRSRRNGSCSPKDMDRLQAMIPPRLRLSLHVNLVSLGRECCTAGDPRCSSCVLNSVCQKVGVHGPRQSQHRQTR